MDLVLAVAAVVLVVLLALAAWLSCCRYLDRAEADPVGPVHLAAHERRAFADLERRFRSQDQPR